MTRNGGARFEVKLVNARYKKKIKIKKVGAEKTKSDVELADEKKKQEQEEARSGLVVRPGQLS